MADLISIIIPVFRTKQFLQRCVASVTNQTYKNLEIILVNDGCPDDSGELCDTLAAEDSRITVIHQTNKGLASTRNVGIDHATGSYLLFIDSDDWIEQMAVKELYTLAVTHDADLVIGNYQRRAEYGSTPSDITLDRADGEPTALSGVAMLKALIPNRSVLMDVSWGKLYRRTLFQTVRFPLERIHEDAFTTYRLIDLADIVVLDERPYYNYFSNPSGIMATRNIKAHEDRLMALCGQFDLVSARGLNLEARLLSMRIFHNAVRLALRAQAEDRLDIYARSLEQATLAASYLPLSIRSLRPSIRPLLFRMSPRYYLRLESRRLNKSKRLPYPEVRADSKARYP